MRLVTAAIFLVRCEFSQIKPWLLLRTLTAIGNLQSADANPHRNDNHRAKIPELRFPFIRNIDGQTDAQEMYAGTQ